MSSRHRMARILDLDSWYLPVLLVLLSEANGLFHWVLFCFLRRRNSPILLRSVNSAFCSRSKWGFHHHRASHPQGHQDVLLRVSSAEAEIYDQLHSQYKFFGGTKKETSSAWYAREGTVRTTTLNPFKDHLQNICKKFELRLFGYSPDFVKEVDFRVRFPGDIRNFYAVAMKKNLLILISQESFEFTGLIQSMEISHQEL